MTAPPEKPRRKRGRPRIAGYEEVRSTSFEQDLSERTRQNHYYALKVFTLLGIIAEHRIKVPRRYRYLVPHADTLKGRVKWDVLQALGRIRNEIMLKTFVDRICQLKPPAKEAVKLIRKRIDSSNWQTQLRYERGVGVGRSLDKIKADLAKMYRDACHDRFPDPPSKEERQKRARDFYEFMSQHAASMSSPAKR